MPLPVQIWMPSFDKNPLDATFSRDLQRAYAARMNEDHVWLLPYALDEPEVLRWYVDRGDLKEQSCMVRSEALNHLMVIHADEARRLYPPVLSGLGGLGTENALPEGFYRLWLKNN